MHTILGAGGAIARQIAIALREEHKQKVKLVSRNPQKVNPTDTLVTADLRKYEQVLEAVKGSKVVYLTVGLPYDTKVWEETWPLIMKNVINACLEYSCKLVFFDNIYLYDGRDLDPIKETNPINPPSRKGKVRAELVKRLWEAVENQGLTALIARCADFYGPSVKNVSLLTETVIKPLSEGKAANWLVSDKYKHSFTYTVDAGRATALLGNNPEAFGETWHLPTAKDPLTGKEWVAAIAKELGQKPKHRNVSKQFVKILGLFIPVMRESVEMLYQYEKDYVFNSEKFEKRFEFIPTPYQDGIKEIVEIDYRN